MPEPDPSDPSRPHVDATTGMAGNEAGRKGGYYGEEFDASAAKTEGSVRVGVDDGGTPEGETSTEAHGRDIPPENGRRGAVDTRTGEVHGSGVGDGGGQEGEDFSSDPMTGDGYPQTGGEGG